MYRIRSLKKTRILCGTFSNFRLYDLRDMLKRRHLAKPLIALNNDKASGKWIDAVCISQNLMILMSHTLTRFKNRRFDIRVLSLKPNTPEKVMNLKSLMKIRPEASKFWITAYPRYFSKSSTYCVAIEVLNGDLILGCCQIDKRSLKITGVLQTHLSTETSGLLREKRKGRTIYREIGPSFFQASTTFLCITIKPTAWSLYALFKGGFSPVILNTATPRLPSRSACTHAVFGLPWAHNQRQLSPYCAAEATGPDAAGAQAADSTGRGAVVYLVYRLAVAW